MAKKPGKPPTKKDQKSWADNIKSQLVEIDNTVDDALIRACLSVADYRVKFGSDKAFATWARAYIEPQYKWSYIRKLKQWGMVKPEWKADGAPEPDPHPNNTETKEQAVARRIKWEREKDRNKKANNRKAPSQDTQIAAAIGMLNSALKGYRKTKILGCDVSVSDLKKILDTVVKHQAKQRKVTERPASIDQQLERDHAAERAATA